MTIVGQAYMEPDVKFCMKSSKQSVIYFNLDHECRFILLYLNFYLSAWRWVQLKHLVVLTIETPPPP